jgi:hypothetical protein
MPRTLLRSGRRQQETVADRDLAGKDRASGHRADPGQGELRSTARRKRPAMERRQIGHLPPAATPPAGDTGAGDRRHQRDPGIRGRFRPAGRAPVVASANRSGQRDRLGERDDAVPQAEEIQDLQMLARLRHRPVVGGDDQQDEIDADGAGEHVVHEALMAGHVDEAQGLAALDRPIGEADVDGDAARLLFGQTVGVDSRERPHQRRLRMIDVASRTDDHGAPSDLKRLCAAALSSAVMTASTRRRNPAASSFPRPAASVSQRKACA